MRLTVVEPPAPIISLLEVVQQTRVDPGDDDLLLTSLVEVATQSIDGPNGWLGRALGEQVIELAAPCFYEGGRAEIGLPCPPLVEVLSVKYDAPDGTEQTIDPARYGVFSQRAVYPKPGFPWPQVAYGGEIRVRYTAGWSVSDGYWSGPAPIRQAILLMVTRLYAHRGEDVSANLVEDRTINALLTPFRVWSV